MRALWSTIVSAPSASPRASIRKYARSVGYAIPCIRRTPISTMPRCWSARPRPRTSVRSRRSTRSAPRSTSWRETESARTSLDKAKRYLIGSYALRFDTSRKIAGQLVTLQLDGHDSDRLERRQREDRRRPGGRCHAGGPSALLGDGSLLIAGRRKTRRAFDPNVRPRMTENVIGSLAPGLSGLEPTPRPGWPAARSPGIMISLDFDLVLAEDGYVVFAGVPGMHAYYPIGTVHGGYAAALLELGLRMRLPFSKLTARPDLHDAGSQGRVPQGDAPRAQAGCAPKAASPRSAGAPPSPKRSSSTAADRLLASATSSLLVMPRSWNAALA